MRLALDQRTKTLTEELKEERAARKALEKEIKELKKKVLDTAK